MARRKDSEDARRRILSACVKLFIENGYTNTRMTDIIREAKVSNSTFQNLFSTKDGVLMDLVEYMFDSQFAFARSTMQGQSQASVYAMETAIQLVMTEINENLREIYVQAYTMPEALEYICQKTSTELYQIFGPYMPERSESDFYEMDIGVTGIMRNYMSRKCDKYFTLEKKIKTFLGLSLSIYHVPKDEAEQIVQQISNVDIVKIANDIMHKLFGLLEMKFDFEFDFDKEKLGG